MTQKQFIKQLMGRGVSHSDACGLVATSLVEIEYY